MDKEFQAPAGQTWWTMLRDGVPVGVILAHTAHEAWQRSRARRPFGAYEYRVGAPDEPEAQS